MLPLLPFLQDMFSWCLYMTWCYSLGKSRDLFQLVAPHLHPTYDQFFSYLGRRPLSTAKSVLQLSQTLQGCNRLHYGEHQPSVCLIWREMWLILLESLCPVRQEWSCQEYDGEPLYNKPTRILVAFCSQKTWSYLCNPALTGFSIISLGPWLMIGKIYSTLMDALKSVAVLFLPFPSIYLYYIKAYPQLTSLLQ